MSNNQLSPRVYDLEKRTLFFAQQACDFVARVPQTMANAIYCNQLLRSSNSVAANYVEATEGVSLPDFIYRLRVCRKESKESKVHLLLIKTSMDFSISQVRQGLIREAQELIRIFTASIKSAEKHLGH